jgi:phosphatidylserine decarboxylase
LEIKYFNRRKNELEVEKVYGDGAVRWLYDSAPGQFLSNFLIKAPISRLYGMTQELPVSKNKIAPFIKNFNIPMEDYLPEEGRSVTDPYSSFNKFFIRRFREGKRPFSQEENILSAFAEARYFGYESLKDDETIPVKGHCMNAKALIDHPNWNETFREGPMLLARLCPVDYHRYHYPDQGKTLDSYRIKGLFHSVNPLALRKAPEVFMVNERQVSILETENFGKLAYVEVGAICVGKIVQSHQKNNFNRGDEKGYFLFGGSTVIVFGEKGKWRPNDDILKYTPQGIETYLQLGEQAGQVT